MWIGEKRACVAAERRRVGQTVVPFGEATWSSTRPEVTAVDGFGILTGRAAGQAMISASFRGRQASVLVSVTEEDGLRVGAAAEQGQFRPGTNVTMTLLGNYSLASAETGRLSLRITDQSSSIVTTTSPLTVAKGGDSFILSSTFVVPGSATQVCRTAVLEIGGTVFSEPKNNDAGLWCIAIQP
jgi:hypothetical protein